MKDLDRMNDEQLDKALMTELNGARVVGLSPTEPIDKTQELLNRMAAVQIDAAIRNMVDNMLLMQRAEAMNAAGVTYLGMQLQTGKGEVSYLALMASWGSPPPTVH